jgi:hypothetical protein
MESSAGLAINTIMPHLQLVYHDIETAMMLFVIAIEYKNENSHAL